MRLAVRGAALLVAGLSLAGCQLIPDVAGVIAAGATGSASANPAVGIAVGIAVRSGVRQLQQYVDRKRHEGEQDAIADAAGSVPVGASHAWEIRHTIPIGNARGELVPVREFRTPLATCREVVFTLDDDGEREIFTTTLCRQGENWRWAAAEPAVDRWGYLQ